MSSSSVDYQKNSFFHRTVRDWNCLPVETGQCMHHSLNSCKAYISPSTDAEETATLVPILHARKFICTNSFLITQVLCSACTLTPHWSRVINYHEVGSSHCYKWLQRLNKFGH